MIFTLRVLIVSIGAPFAACALLSPVLFDNFEQGALGPIGFALPGSVLLLTLGYGSLREQDMPLWHRYVALAGLGLVAGGIMLGIVSVGTGSFAAMGLGALYGFSTALCWIFLHAMTRKWSKT